MSFRSSWVGNVLISTLGDTRVGVTAGEGSSATSGAAFCLSDCEGTDTRDDDGSATGRLSGLAVRIVSGLVCGTCPLGLRDVEGVAVLVDDADDDNELPDGADRLAEDGVEEVGRRARDLERVDCTLMLVPTTEEWAGEWDCSGWASASIVDDDEQGVFDGGGECLCGRALLGRERMAVD